MASTDTQLLLRLSADVARFQKQMSRIMKSGENAAVGVENRFRQSNRRMAQNAEQSANAIGQEMDRLRAKYDPLFAASKRYERELEDLNRAHRVGALSTQQHEAALERLNAEYARSTTTAKTAGRSFRGMGGGIQNVSYQVADFATQVGAGTSAAQAFGQQAPQLLAGFGAVGAVLGAVAAIAVPLAAAFFRNGEAAKTLEERAQDLTSAVDDYRDAVRQASLPTEELAEKYGTATTAAREFIGALREITEVTALEQLDDTFDSIATSLGNMNAVRNPLGMLQEADAIRRLREDFGIAADEAQRVADAVQALGRAEGPQEQADAAADLLKELEAALGPYEDMNSEARDLYRRTQQAGDEAAQLAGAADGAAGAIGGAASEAGRLADELGRAVNNAISLAAQGISDLRQAEIEYQYRNDPVGRAGALARERFDSQTDLPADADSTIKNVVEQERREFVAAATEAERYRQSLIKWRQAQAAAASASKAASKKGGSSGGSKKSGGSGGRGREEDPLFQSSDEEMQRIERRIELIGKTEAESARLQARYELLDEAKRRGLDLDAKQAQSGETLREQIERQAEAVGELAGKYSQAQEKAKFYDDMQGKLKDGLVDAIVEGENFAGVLADVARMLAKAALQAALFGEGPMAGGGGSGLLGGLFSGIFGGQRAAGGPVQAGKMYMDGAHGREPFVPAVNGRILSTAQAQKALRGGEGSTTVVNAPYSPTINAQGADPSAIERIEANQRRMAAEFDGRVAKAVREARTTRRI